MKQGDRLLDYILKLDVKTPTPDASTDYLRQVCVAVKPKSSVQTGTITKVISAPAAETLTANKDLAQLFAAGMNAVFVLPMDTLDLTEALSAARVPFNTLLISSDFSKSEIDALDVGDYNGVVGAAFEEQADAKAFATHKNRIGWKTNATNGAANLFYAVGALLSATEWNNQQYIELPKDDGIADTGTAESLFADKISFALTSEQYGTRLAFFAVGGQAIIAPYVTKELINNLQGAALRYLTVNTPQYTLTQAKRLEDFLNQDAAKRYVTTGLLDYVRTEVSLTKSNYEGSVSVRIPEPSALWRLKGVLTQEAN